MVETMVATTAMITLFHADSASCWSWKIARYQCSEKPCHTVKRDELKLKTARITSGAERARRGVRGVVRSPQVRRALRHAAAHRRAPVPARHLRGWPPHPLSRVLRPRARDAEPLLAAGRDGLHRRGLSRYDRHRAPAWPAARRRPRPARDHEG